MKCYCFWVEVLFICVLFKIGTVNCQFTPRFETFFDYNNNKIWHCANYMSILGSANANCPSNDVCWEVNAESQWSTTKCGFDDTLPYAKVCSCKTGQRLVNTSGNTANCFRICEDGKYAVCFLCVYGGVNDVFFFGRTSVRL